MTVYRDHFCGAIGPFEEPEATVDMFFPCRGSSHLPEPFNQFLSTIVDVFITSVRESHRTGVKCQCEKFYDTMALWTEDFAEALREFFDKV